MLLNTIGHGEKMKYDLEIIRDKNGLLKFPETIKLGLNETKQIVELLYMLTLKNIGINQLDVTFEEKFTKNKKSIVYWDYDQDKYVLLHYADLDEFIGEAIGRTAHAVAIEKSQLLTGFNVWKEKNPNLIKNKSYEELVDLYLETIYDDDE